MTSDKLRVLPVVHRRKTGSRRTNRLVNPPKLPNCVAKLRTNVQPSLESISRSDLSVPGHRSDTNKNSACPGTFVEAAMGWLSLSSMMFTRKKILTVAIMGLDRE